MLLTASVFCIALALTVFLQSRSHAYASEWSFNADESAHYVTGLLVHDYVAQGFPQNPQTLADNFDAHYPKVGIGHWPPGFYVVQAAWTLLFGTSRISLLMLMAVIAASVLTITYVITARYFPGWIAFGSTVVLAVIPGFQEFSRSLMPDMLVGLLTLLSLLVLATHLQRPQWRTGLWFGALAVATILTKGTGLVLAPLPILGALQLRRARLFRRWAFWAPAILVLVVCVPWFLLAPDALHQSVALFGGLRLRLYRPGESLSYWIRMLGVVAAPLTAFGVARAIRQYGSTDALWALLLWLPVAAAAFRMFIGAWEKDYLIATLPIMTPFLCAGLQWFSGTFAPHRNVGNVCSALLILIACMTNVTRLPSKPHLGLDNVARVILSDQQLAGTPLLIVSDAQGEGAFIAEIASGERRPGHIVERGSKVLATSGFMGTAYRERFTTPAELMQFFDANPDLIVLLDTPDHVPPHVDLVRNTVAAYARRWRTLATFPRWHSSPDLHPQSTIRVLALVSKTS